MTIVRQISSELPVPRIGQDRILSLRFIDGGAGFVSLAQSQLEAPEGEPFEVLLETRTPLARTPTHAVWAEWRLDLAEDVNSFRARAVALFETRRQNIDSFVLDWLLKSVEHDDLLLVVGLYTSEDGARNLSRGHPAVADFAKAHPAPYARNDSGLSIFEVLEANLSGPTL